jgi:hypothetical protein
MLPTSDRDDATTEFGDVLILNGKHMSSRHAELRLGPRSAAGFSCRRCLPQIVGRTEFFMPQAADFNGDGMPDCHQSSENVVF